ncbi:MAG TPA: ribonuclease P protein component [Nocardioidaceae bacterium]|nr:ribonuclease P protein component [Nocardioidaceae bacterium]
MLARAHRLRRSEEIARAVRRGRRASTATLTVHAERGEDPPRPARVAFVVSKAVGDAVTRNRVKRRLRHAAAAALPGLPAGCDLVVRAKPAAARASFVELAADLGRALRQVDTRQPLESR